MLWWKHDDRGYVCEIREAKVFTRVEIDKMQSIKEGSKKAWPKAYIDRRVSHHIDSQHCDSEAARAETEGVE
ncbi:hypothetical protein LCGC14_2873090 [marine sediment metagenome]|uniref:Uncharacterized protein n=1 Tax=marine sediment metagenome TaxID=412755 RepID=A0A0F8Y296_9ZZZZ